MTSHWDAASVGKSPALKLHAGAARFLPGRSMPGIGAANRQQWPQRWAGAQIEHTRAGWNELRGKFGPWIAFLFWGGAGRNIRREFESQIAVDVEIHSTRAEVRPDPAHAGESIHLTNHRRDSRSTAQTKKFKARHPDGPPGVTDRAKPDRCCRAPGRRLWSCISAGTPVWRPTARGCLLPSARGYRRTGSAQFCLRARTIPSLIESESCGGPSRISTSGKPIMIERQLATNRPGRGRYFRRS